MRVFLAFAAALLLSACGMPPPQRQAKTHDQAQPADQADTQAPEGAAKYSPMARAKAVSADVMEAKQEQDKEIEKQQN